MKTGRVRRADVQTLEQLQADLAHLPAPLVGSELAAVTAGTTLVDAGTSTSPEAYLPVARALTQADRLLLCGSLEQSSLRGLVALALASKVDVWLLEEADASVALGLIEALGITLCYGQLRSAAGNGIICLSSSGEIQPAGHAGWLSGSKLRSSDGPVGYVDQQGWVHVLGSSANCIHADESLLMPYEGAARLASHPRVTGACLLAVSADRALGQGLSAGFFGCAEVTGDRSPVLEVELLEFMRRGLSAAKCPQGIILVEVLPRTRSGAPDLDAVWALVEQQSSSVADLPESTGQ